MIYIQKSKNGKYISTPAELFERHCIKGLIDECWIWNGYITPNGYGQTRIGGRNSKAIQAHRLSWLVNFGEIPKDMHILHKCDNRPCCNPNHLFIGTNLDNILDRVSKDRSNRWIKTAPREKHPRTKIMNEQLKDMLQLKQNKIKVMDIAKQFNISKEYCSRLLTSAQKGELSWCL
jgi:hypothetical protein